MHSLEPMSFKDWQTSMPPSVYTLDSSRPASEGQLAYLRKMAEIEPHSCDRLALQLALVRLDPAKQADFSRATPFIMPTDDILSASEKTAFVAGLTSMLKITCSTGKLQEKCAKWTSRAAVAKMMESSWPASKPDEEERDEVRDTVFREIVRRAVNLRAKLYHLEPTEEEVRAAFADTRCGGGSVKETSL